MNWFKRLFKRNDRNPVPGLEVSDCYRLSSSDLFEDVARLNFSVVRAQGGIVVQVRKYGYDNRAHTRSSNNDDQPVIHVIPDTEDFQASLNKIIVLETLRA